MMKTNLTLTYKVSLAKTRFVINGDGSYTMSGPSAPMISFDGPEFNSEADAKKHIASRIKEDKEKFNAAGSDWEVLGHRMLRVQMGKVVMIFTYSIVNVFFGILSK